MTVSKLRDMCVKFLNRLVELPGDMLTNTDAALIKAKGWSTIL